MILSASMHSQFMDLWYGIACQRKLGYVMKLKQKRNLKTHLLVKFVNESTLITSFMGPTLGHLGPTGPRWAQCWPYELYYLGPDSIKMSSYQYRKSHCADKTVVRSSYLHNGIYYTGKMSSLYWIGALGTLAIWFWGIIVKRPRMLSAQFVAL